ncbi:MAG: hypothetical protein KAH57_07135 [Thermoplasmata archaeon]|nr:hypothetical protein [Thermoplasmata archaeon]
MAGKHRIRDMVDQWRPGVFVIMALVKTFQLLGKMGLNRKEEGWRKATRAFMYAEHTKFILGTFSLDIWSDSHIPKDRSLKVTSEHIAERLYSFLSGEEAAHDKICLNGRDQVRVRKDQIDVTIAEYSREGDLVRIGPRMDPCDDDFKGVNREHVDGVIVRTFNATRNLKDRIRPIGLMRKLGKTLRGEGEMDYAERVVTSIFLQFEVKHNDGADRFDEPDFRTRLHPGLGMMNILCILRDDMREADMWFHISHIPIDGVPALEILERQRKQWGTRKEIVYPRIGTGIQFPLHLISTGRRRVYRAGSLMDFSRVRDIRNRLNRRLGERIGGDIPPIALLGWCMEHHDAFRGRKLHIPVDLPKTTERERTLGFVFVRPSRFFRRDDPEAAFVDFIRYFNDTASRAKERDHVNQCFMDAVALSPIFIFHLTRSLIPGALEEYLGGMGLSVVKTSYVGAGVMPDNSRGGYVVLNNYTVPDGDGGVAGYISVTGLKEQVERNSKALAEILQDVDVFMQFKV